METSKYNEELQDVPVESIPLHDLETFLDESAWMTDRAASSSRKRSAAAHDTALYAVTMDTNELSMQLCEHIVFDGSVDRARELLERGANPSLRVYRHTPCQPKIWNAIEVGMRHLRADVIELFCARKLIDDTPRLYEPFVEAIEDLCVRFALYDEYLKCWELLENASKIVNVCPPFTPSRIHHASIARPIETLDSTDQRDARSLVRAVRNGLARRNLSLGMKRNGVYDVLNNNCSLPLELTVDGCTPLLVAARTLKSAVVMRALCDEGARLDARDPDDYTPLHLAVKSLLSKIANRMLRCSSYRPLFLTANQSTACSSNHDAVMEELCGHRRRFSVAWHRNHLIPLRVAVDSVRALLDHAIQHEAVFFLRAHGAGNGSKRARRQ